MLPIEFVEQSALSEPGADDAELVFGRQTSFEAADSSSDFRGISRIAQIGRHRLDEPRHVIGQIFDMITIRRHFGDRRRTTRAEQRR